jgi:ubiquinone/menaquinone biosynthesis C-methylase UbiE
MRLLTKEELENEDGNYINYPENPSIPLNGRIKLAYDWIPEKSNILLDGGCAWGYGTCFFKKKCNNTYGIDPNEGFITLAKKRYPFIQFLKSGLENTPFKSNFFEVIILNDVIEHVKDESQSLNEMFRILKPEGILIITTLNKGMFSFIDPDNFVFFLRKKLPAIYKLLYRIKKGKYPGLVRPGYEAKHRHYSTSNLRSMLNNSKFKNRYDVVKIFRSGLFMEGITSNLDLFLSFILGKKSTSVLLKPLLFLSKFDFWIPYSLFSYNLAFKIIKK